MSNQPIVEKCEGCEKVIDNVCSIWYSPETRWRIGRCPNATHITIDFKKEDTKRRTGQQKQKKKKK